MEGVQMEKQWIPLSNAQFPIEHRSLQGVKVDVLVSPYDVPEAVRGHFDHSKRCFTIEFKYISQEAIVERSQDPNVKLWVGRNSGRLYAIELDLAKFSGNSVQLRLEVAEELRNVLTHLVKQPIFPMRESNYRMAKKVVETNKELILQ
jgi:hypothetical protein